jgi:hypothetical protein
VPLHTSRNGAGADTTPRLPIRLLDRAAAADYLSISLDTLDRLCRHGQIRRVLLASTRCVRFDLRELDRFVSALAS